MIGSSIMLVETLAAFPGEGVVRVNLEDILLEMGRFIRAEDEAWRGGDS